MSKHIVIIGNGIAGVSAAREIRKHSDFKITIISEETKYFFSRTALMYIYMGHMRFKDTQPYEPSFWIKNKIELIQDRALSIDFSKKNIALKNNSSVTYDSLILATGSKPNKFGWKGQDLKGVQGLYSYQDLKLLEENTKKGINRAVIVGGGLIGIELAEMLHSRNYPVTFLVREQNFWGNVLPKEQSEVIVKHMIDDYHIDLKCSTELDEIQANDHQRVTSITTKSGTKIDCELVGLTAGVSPNIDFLRSTNLKVNRGILVDEYLQTNIEDVYAIGDCAEFVKHPKTDRRNIEQVWYTGKMMGLTVGKTISGQKTSYQPGHWFNSAKFFDIEYQTYGWVFAQLQAHQEKFFWKHPEKNINIYMVFDKASRKFIGINTFGLRLRHELFDRWLTEKRTIDYILEHLKSANFDPEFYATQEASIINAFNKQFNTNLSVKAKSWKSILNF